MPRIRKGAIVEKNGKVYARVRYTTEDGKRKDLWLPAKNKTHAQDIIQDKIKELKDHGEKTVDASRMTFEELASYFEKNFLIPAEYVDGRKIVGRRSVKGLKEQVEIMKSFFKGKLLRSISYGDLWRFKLLRLKTPTKRKEGTRAIASVHRELALLRRMLNIAVREQWLLKNPFHFGESLISPADEKKRERILTREEETNLLNACDQPKCKHLRAIIICALDSGMRQGEILKLKWADVDCEAGLITVCAFNTKTMKERTVAITTRLKLELERLWKSSAKNSDDLVFRYSDNVKNSFTTVREKAKLNDLRFHDLRHTHATRLDDLGFSMAKIANQLGHTQLQTTLRYVNRDKSSVLQVASALDSFNAEQQPKQQETVSEVTELVN
ncbi:MAG TPA: site-specific integrase [Pyrinomonadaceae bacterium]|jgi:integrase|nr:site-specific integrase [Pyrinomonadaceae bacterium]